MTKVAVLLTCHNRKEKTVSCLEAFYNCSFPANHNFEVFLVDDGSVDGTAEAVLHAFPGVRIITGSGHLFWNQGMRLAWKVASETKDFDFYVWLNDDTILDSGALTALFESYGQAFFADGKPAIICGACRSDANSNDFSYGGRNEVGPVIPNGTIQRCRYTNGNFVLVPQALFKILGNLSGSYTHAFGDIDYGLRAQVKGFQCYTTPIFVGTCQPHQGIPTWSNPQTPLLKRWKLSHSIKGLNMKEYLIFRRRFWGWKWILYGLKAYLKIIFPGIYGKFSS